MASLTRTTLYLSLIHISDIRWSRTGRIQLNEEVTVTLTLDVDIGFGGLGSFPIELTAQASGRSEVYWK